MTTTVKTYYIVKAEGTYQQYDINKKLTKPRPFIGFVSSIEQGYSIDEEHAYRFDEPPLVDDVRFGPWWYNVTSHKVFRVTETITTIEEELQP